MTSEPSKKARATSIDLKPLPRSPTLSALRMLGTLVIPVAMTAIAVNAPAPILIGLAALAWIYATVLLVGYKAFWPRADVSYFVAIAMLVCGLLSFAASVLNVMASAMSPIGRDAPLLPFFVFGGLALQLAGVVVLFAGYKSR